MSRRMRWRRWSAPPIRARGEILVSLVKHLHRFIREVRLTEARVSTGHGRPERDRQAEHRYAQRIRADGGLARGLVARVPPQQRRQWQCRDVAIAARSVLAAEFPARRQWRHNCSVGHARRPAVRHRSGGRHGRAIRSPGAEVDIWHASPVGLYENQDAEQADMNLRGKFTTDDDGRFWFATVRMVGYPIPTDGVVGRLLQAQNRHPYRPAHLHALIVKEGFKVLISQVYDPSDPNIDTDPQFGVTRALLGDYRRHEESHPVGPHNPSALVFARPHLRHGAGRNEAPGAADQVTRAWPGIAVIRVRPSANRGARLGCRGCIRRGSVQQLT